MRVVFADDSYLVRVAVSALLNQGEEIELITAVGDADALIRAVVEHQPDAVLTAVIKVALTQITCVGSLRAPVTDVQLAATVATT